LAAALALPDDSGWHPFRIAVKDLRSQADRLADDTGLLPDQQAVIATCKDLQAQLGAWHDCVVQLQLFDELQPATGTRSRLLRELRDRVEALRRERLAGIRQALAGQSLLRPTNGGNG
jgi:CHAD domain-containing protein